MFCFLGWKILSMLSSSSDIVRSHTPTQTHTSSASRSKCKWHLGFVSLRVLDKTQRLCCMTARERREAAVEDKRGWRERKMRQKGSDAEMMMSRSGWCWRGFIQISLNILDISYSFGFMLYFQYLLLWYLIDSCNWNLRNLKRKMSNNTCCTSITENKAVSWWPYLQLCRVTYRIHTCFTKAWKWLASTDSNTVAM